MELRDYLAVLRRQLVVIVAVTLLGAGAAAWSFRRTPVYESTASVLVRAIPTNAFDPGQRIDQQLNMFNQRQLAQSEPVAAVAAKLLRTTATPAQLLEHVQVDVPANSQILRVRYRDTVPLTAQRGADAFAEAYLGFREADAAQRAAQRLPVARLHPGHGDRRGRPAQPAGQPQPPPRHRHRPARRAVPGRRRRVRPRPHRRPAAGSPGPGRPPGPAGPGHRPAPAPAGPPGPAALAATAPRQPGHPGAAQRPGRRGLPDPAHPHGPAGRPARHHLGDGRLGRGGGGQEHDRGQPGRGPGRDRQGRAAGLGRSAPGPPVLRPAQRLGPVRPAQRRRHRRQGPGRHGRGRPGGLEAVVGGAPSVGAAVGPAAQPPLGPDGLRRHAPVPPGTARPVRLPGLDCPPALVVADTLALAPLADAVLVVADARVGDREAVSRMREELEQVGGRIVGAVLDRSRQASCSSYYYDQAANPQAAPVP